MYHFLSHMYHFLSHMYHFLSHMYHTCTCITDNMTQNDVNMTQNDTTWHKMMSTWHKMMSSWLSLFIITHNLPKPLVAVVNLPQRTHNLPHPPAVDVNLTPHCALLNFHTPMPNILQKHMCNYSNYMIWHHLSYGNRPQRFRFCPRTITNHSTIQRIWHIL